MSIFRYTDRAKSEEKDTSNEVKSKVKKTKVNVVDTNDNDDASKEESFFGRKNKASQNKGGEK